MSHAVPPPPVAYAVVSDARVDDGHLAALAIGHYVWAALLAAGSCFGLIHVAMGVLVLTGRIDATPSPGGPPIEAWFGYLFIGIGMFVLVAGWSLAIATLIAGRSLTRHRRRTLILVVAILNCLMVPLGTLLGIFTLVVILRDSVRQRFEHEALAHRA